MSTVTCLVADEYMEGEHLPAIVPLYIPVTWSEQQVGMEVSGWCCKVNLAQEMSDIADDGGRIAEPDRMVIEVDPRVQSTQEPGRLHHGPSEGPHNGIAMNGDEGCNHIHRDLQGKRTRSFCRWEITPIGDCRLETSCTN